MLLIRPSDFAHVFRRRTEHNNDTEWIINNALETMKERQMNNREKAVRVITRANFCENILAQERAMIAALHRKRREKLRSGSRDLAELIQIEIDARRKVLNQIAGEAKNARQRAGDVKQAVRDEENRFRRAWSRAHAFKVLIQAWKADQAFAEIEEGLKRDGYFDLPPEPVRDEQSMDSPPFPEVANGNPDPQTQTPPSRRRLPKKR
jgi:phage shock protein A